MSALPGRFYPKGRRGRAPGKEWATSGSMKCGADAHNEARKRRAAGENARAIKIDGAWYVQTLEREMAD